MSSQSSNVGDNIPGALLHPRYWPAWFAIGCFYLLSLLPVAFLDVIGKWLGKLLASKNLKRRRIVMTNLQLCFPDKPLDEIEQMMLAHFEYLMRGIMHYGLIWWASEKRLQRHLQLEGFEQVSEIQQSGQNVIVLLSHCTGLEFAVSALSQQFACSGPYKPFKHPVVDWLIARARRRFNDLLPFSRDEGLRPIIRQARQGRVIIYLADEDLGADVSVFAPFFGINKATIPILGRLAQSCDAKVLPAISCYDPQKRHYRVRLFPAMQEFPVQNQQQDTELMNQMIETTVRFCPAQYFWTLKLFKTRPSGEARIYQ